jgi:hypothetical protein
MRDPRPYLVFRAGRFLFSLHAYSEQQARDLIAARLSDTADIVVTAPRHGAPSHRDIYRD